MLHEPGLALNGLIEDCIVDGGIPADDLQPCSADPIKYGRLQRRDAERARCFVSKAFRCVSNVFFKEELETNIPVCVIEPGTCAALLNKVYFLTHLTFPEKRMVSGQIYPLPQMFIFLPGRCHQSKVEKKIGPPDARWGNDTPGDRKW